MGEEGETSAPHLFGDPDEERVTPLGRVEPAVHWLTESTRPEAAASRQTVNRWYASFPDADGTFGERLRSEADVDHHQALDELHVHHLLTRHHDDVRYEEGGVGPDFRIYDGGICVAPAVHEMDGGAGLTVDRDAAGGRVGIGRSAERFRC